MRPVDEIVALDLLTLRDHTESAGDVLDAQTLRRSIEESLKISEFVSVSRNGVLVAYAMLQPQEAGRWFVTGFNTHPGSRTAPVLRELLEKLLEAFERNGIVALRSNVYKTNLLSMAFHNRLGFSVTKENAKGVEFTATMETLRANPSLKWTARARPSSGILESVPESI